MKNAFSQALLIPPTLWHHQYESPLTLPSISALPYYYNISLSISLKYPYIEPIKRMKTH